MVRDAEVVRLDGPPWLVDPVPGDSLGRLAELELEAPATPSKIVCVGRNYAAHAREHDAEVPAEPLLFLKPPSSLLAPGRAIVLPSQSERVEHEGELALVIGQRCQAVTAAEAWSRVAGVTCANDVTARDLQRQDKTWTRGKGFDTFCPVGPWVAVGLGEDEVNDLAVSCRVNGEIRQQGRTSAMAFPPAIIVAYVSTIMTLEPGDLVLTGTPAGVGPLRAGDQVEVDVEGVGVLANPVG
jgi:2-keto-4-pentenoate hydratase/2-oxohepta-3-ene-1,7-dioic acid hydratase in catechol pathway